MLTNISIIGTIIWGSSSLGRTKTAAIPKMIDAIMISGVSFEFINARAILPAAPTGCFMRPPFLNPIKGLQGYEK
jgi:hypothetical protein